MYTFRMWKGMRRSGSRKWRNEEKTSSRKKIKLEKKRACVHQRDKISSRKSWFSVFDKRCLISSSVQWWLARPAIFSPWLCMNSSIPSFWPLFNSLNENIPYDRQAVKAKRHVILLCPNSMLDRWPITVETKENATISGIDCYPAINHFDSLS